MEKRAHARAREKFRLTPDHRVVAKSGALESGEDLADRRVELR